jgi:hypothetical protein
MKWLLVVAALVAPSLGFGATLTGTWRESTETVNLANVGTLDYARWPGYTTKARTISNLTISGRTTNITNDPRIIGNRNAIKGYMNSSFEFTAPATTSERTLYLYVGGWNSTLRVTATLPGAKNLTLNINSSKTYSSVVQIKYKGDSNSTLRVKVQQVAGSSGNIRIQAAALQGASTATPTPTPTPKTGSAVLSWTPPRYNTDGSALADLAGYRVYWGQSQGNYPNSARINNASTRSFTISGLPAGRWYFVVTAVNAAGKESGYSNVASKLIQ